MAMFNVHRAITPKVSKPELQFINSARHLIKFQICVIFITPVTSVQQMQLGTTNAVEILLTGKKCGSLFPLF